MRISDWSSDVCSSDLSPAIRLLEPTGLQRPYYAEFGWVAASGATAQVPTPETMWTADSDVLAPGKPVTLSWSNGQGLPFQRFVSVDEAYLFTVSHRVVHGGAEAVTLYPYGRISLCGTSAPVCSDPLPDAQTPL